MIVRKCAQDHNVVIHLNNKPGMAKKITKDKQITYPSSKKYFLIVDGSITKKSDSFETIEKEYVKSVALKTADGHGRFDIVKHKLVKNKVTLR